MCVWIATGGAALSIGTGACFAAACDVTLVCQASRQDMHNSETNTGCSLAEA